MNVDYIINSLNNTRFEIMENKRNGNNLATVLKLSNG